MVGSAGKHRSRKSTGVNLKAQEKRMERGENRCVEKPYSDWKRKLHKELNLEEDFLKKNMHQTDRQNLPLGKDCRKKIFRGGGDFFNFLQGGVIRERVEES